MANIPWHGSYGKSQKNTTRSNTTSASSAKPWRAKSLQVQPTTLENGTQPVWKQTFQVPKMEESENLFFAVWIRLILRENPSPKWPKIRFRKPSILGTWNCWWTFGSSSSSTLWGFSPDDFAFWQTEPLDIDKNHSRKQTYPTFGKEKFIFFTPKEVDPNKWQFPGGV